MENTPDIKDSEKVVQKQPEESSPKKKKTIPIIISIVVLLLIGAYIIARPEILKGNFDPDYLLFRDSVEETTEQTEKENLTEEETEPTLVWKIDFEEKLNSVAVSADGQSVAIGEYLKASILNLSDGELKKVLEFKHSVDDLEFSLDSKILAGGQGVNGTLLNDVETGSEIKALHGGYNSYLAFSPDGEHIATGNREGTIWIWDLESYNMVKELNEEEPTWIKSLVYHPDGNLLAVTHWGETNGNPYINVWDIEKEEIAKRIDLSVTVGKVANLVKYSPEGNLMAVADRNDSFEYFIQLYDVVSGEEDRKIAIDKNQYDLDFSPDGKMIAVGVQAEPVKIYDVDTGNLLYTFDQTGFETGVSNWVLALSFTPDGNHVVVTRGDNSLELWELPE